ncbi:MAG: hypothetical protein Q9200_003241 [Gallowayella weberi]
MDEELRAEIFQDVERCMPENLYFRLPSTQSMLLDILFIYCKLNPDVGYRQGMHEVLAPILWVISRDAIDPEAPNNARTAHVPEYRLIGECFDGHFTEHDTFTLFGIVMQTVKSFYEVGDVTQTSSSPATNSPIVERSRRIHEVYLRQADAELAAHLTTIEILPQIFLIRWIRLLFGREFPLDHVLALWDTLFAEDPTLDLVDLVCVSMLLRIKWELLDADYSEALTLLLRYPLPRSPNEPSTFVSDAIYLRSHLMDGGGAHIVSKYSEKTHGMEGATGLTKSSSGRRSRNFRPTETNVSFSPRRSAAKFLQEQGGIDHIIQEAAKGVYSRGEKWGVNKAFRGAIEGLQTGTNSPRKQANGSRWSLDEGQAVPSMADVNAKLAALEQRNKALAKLLGTAMEELWVQQRRHNEGNEEDLANALSLAVAKVQFVQVYLENSAMPFAMDASVAEATVPEGHEKDVPINSAAGDPKESQGSQSHDEIAKSRVSDEPNPDVSQPQMEDAKLSAGSSLTGSGTKDMNTKSSPQPSPFYRPRPSLAQSSFSWMLGEDQRKSSFVSPSPFPSDRRAAREKAGFLFGEGKTKVEPEGKAQKGKTERKTDHESEDEEVINLGTIRGRK